MSHFTLLEVNKPVEPNLNLRPGILSICSCPSEGKFFSCSTVISNSLLHDFYALLWWVGFLKRRDPEPRELIDIVVNIRTEGVTDKVTLFEGDISCGILPRG